MGWGEPNRVRDAVDAAHRAEHIERLTAVALEAARYWRNPGLVDGIAIATVALGYTTSAMAFVDEVQQACRTQTGVPGTQSWMAGVAAQVVSRLAP